jgi:hypothetical protein
VRREKYKGLEIDARALPLRGDNGWLAQVNLIRHVGDSSTVTPFDIQATYDSEEAALEAAVLHGRKKIDDGFVERIVE